MPTGASRATTEWCATSGRRPPTRCSPGIEPLLEVATRSGFDTLADESNRELVIGTHVARNAFAAMNFRVAPEDGGSLITTETRVFASTASARRGFTWYWRLIHPGSALIRRSWLHAIRKRAESV